MSRTILCADDSKTMQTVAEITFRVSDYQYVGALSADEAMDKARAQKPALILADAVMPGKTGYDLCEMVKADPELADVPVIMLCGNSAPYDPARGSKVGADGHLTKPWDTQVMLDKLAELLDKFSGAGAKAGAAARPAPAVAARPPQAAPTTSAPPVAAAQPAVTPKPPIMPRTPAAAAATAASKPESAQVNRTKTMMGMPSMTPPAPPAPKPPARAATAVPNPTPLAEPLPPPRPPATAKSPLVTQPLASKPVKPPRPESPADAAPEAKRAGTRPGGGDPIKPATPTAQAAPALPSKYAPPSGKSAITQPGVPEPPRPAPARGETQTEVSPLLDDISPQQAVPTAPSTSARTAAPVAPLATGDSESSRAATEPVTQAGKVVPLMRPGASGGVNRPPMIRGVPRKRPTLPPAMTMAQQSAGASARIAAATSAAAANAAREVGLDPNGPEMRALLALSKEVVERVVWEVVPDLAETIIRENLSQLTRRG